MDRPFDPVFALTLLPRLLAFLPVTAGVTVASALVGSLLGLLVARLRLSSRRVPAALGVAYVSLLRCTPSIVLLFVVYYGLPALLESAFSVPAQAWHRATFVIIALSLLFSATMAEVFRSAWLSVDRGQAEAALSAGLSPIQAQLRIVLPQAAVSALPNFGNALIALMKEGALAYLVGLIDMMGQGFLTIARNYGARSLETYLALAAVYWCITVALERLFRFAERRLTRGMKGLSS